MPTADVLRRMRGYDPRTVGNDALGDSVPVEQRALEAIMQAAGGYMTVPAGVGLAQGVLRQAPKVLASEAGALFPEDLARLNGKDFYHGSGTPGLTQPQINPMSTSHENLFGQGLYMTDNPSIAESYARSRATAPASQALYKARLNATKGIDLEAPLEPEFKDIVMKQARALGKDYGMTGEEGLAMPSHDAISNIENGIKTGSIKTNQDLFKAFRRMVSDISVEEGIPTTEFVEHFQELGDAFKQKGYQVFRHTGGLRAGQGKTLHEVAVLLDPSALSEFSQVKP